MARVSRKNKAEQTPGSVVESMPGLYVRLSLEDNGGRGKDSIENQKEMLIEFTERYFPDQPVHIYIDNGFTGTDFERPEWEHLMNDVKSRIINCIIVKDLSRMGRNYIEVGDYLGKVFPFLDVRVIAVNDRYDSMHEIYSENEIITDFKNLANDYYSKDISKKVMSAFQTKRQKGECLGAKAPFGYVIEENHFKIDEPAALVVKRIFSMRLQGLSTCKIARILNEEDVSCPSRYSIECGFTNYGNCANMLWTPKAVLRILRNRVYTGDMVYGRCEYSCYSLERLKLKKEEEWIITKNVHPAIIEKDMFEAVQKDKEKLKTKYQWKFEDLSYDNILQGIFFCGICGHSMYRTRNIRKGKAQYCYYCASYLRYSDSKCAKAYIIDYKIFDIIKDQINLQIDLAVEAEHMISQLKESGKYKRTISARKKTIDQTKSNLNRYRYLRTEIYEDFKQGILTKEEYIHAKEEYISKISDLEKRLEMLESELNTYQQNVSVDNKWLKAFLSYRNEEELTREMVVELIEKVELFENRRLEITFKFKSEYESLMSISKNSND